MTAALEEERQKFDRLFQSLIGNPYRADEYLNEMRVGIVQVAKVLMENEIPVAKPKHARGATDVLQEATAELAMMFGSNAMAKGVNMVNKVRSDMQKARDGVPAHAEEIEIYEDEETGEFFYYDENGEEVLCTEDGFPLEGDFDDA